MCLNIFKNDVQVAEQDITCYKFLRLSSCGEKFVSPFQEFEYELDKEYETKMTVELSGDIEGEYITDYWREVEEGFHTIASEKTTVYFAERRTATFRGHHRYVVVECVIPKGASYYEGTWRGSAGYASDKLKVVKVLSIHAKKNDEKVWY